MEQQQLQHRTAVVVVVVVVVRHEHIDEAVNTHPASAGHMHACISGILYAFTQPNRPLLHIGK